MDMHRYLVMWRSERCQRMGHIHRGERDEVIGDADIQLAFDGMV